jgi:hypothetical protein
MKFVPASGAASRMFGALSAWAARPNETLSPELRRTLSKLHRMALAGELNRRLRKQGWNLKRLVAQKRVREVLDVLLSPKEMGLAGLPKGLLPFHSYADGPRTAFEEHLAESARFVADRRGVCRLHFTVPADHRPSFRNLLRRVSGAAAPVSGSMFPFRFRTLPPIPSLSTPPVSFSAGRMEGCCSGLAATARSCGTFRKRAATWSI